jgi:hypothetical protein
MVFLTHRMIISASPNTLRHFTLRSMAFLISWTKASYSLVLLVHSNSKQHDMGILDCSRSINTHPAPAPSHDLEPSKNMDHMSEILVLLVAPKNKLVNMVQALLCVRGRSYDCIYGCIYDVCSS